MEASAVVGVKNLGHRVRFFYAFLSTQIAEKTCQYGKIDAINV